MRPLDTSTPPEPAPTALSAKITAPNQHLIPLIIQAALGRRQSVAIYGTDYETPDGTCVRDYIHIEDLCRAHLLALEKLETETELVYNLGNGTGYSVRQVIDAVKKIQRQRFQSRRSSPQAGRSGDTYRPTRQNAITELGWKPKFGELEQIIETGVEVAQ